MAETTQTINSDTVILKVRSNAIPSDSNVLAPVEQAIDSDSVVLVETAQTIDAETLIKEPIFLFAKAQVDQSFEAELEAETDLDNSIPSAPTGLVAV